MFDQVQTFSSNIVYYKQMFDRLATLPYKACKSGKKLYFLPTWDYVDLACHVIISAVIRTKRSVSFVRCVINHCLPV